jgi:hypothetical protein
MLIINMTWFSQDMVNARNYEVDTKDSSKVHALAVPQPPPEPNGLYLRNFIVKIGSSLRFLPWQREELLRNMVLGRYKTEGEGMRDADRHMACNCCEWALVSAWNLLTGVRRLASFSFAVSISCTARVCSSCTA